MTQPTQPIRIIVQPKALYRERYGSEQNKTGKQVQRYIRAEENQLKLEYPTIEQASCRQRTCAGAVNYVRHPIWSVQRRATNDFVRI
ncbi:unnamed protein product [Adineta steineri]|uniref:Uncharacterized protein n=1 Tax=Adineta steineri TaxID=433720 RepID=A0A813NUU3_9BILA|nr:unnamed protein product [Adineta steineri]CAF0739157.1 unnamed protein product [Adineta steineri]CAF0770556.1 unnamed protein product [Adineta steineri]